VGKQLVVIKIGGLAATHEATLQVLLQEMFELKKRYQWLLVHGGGKEVTQVSEKFGLTAQFHDGIRLTTPEEMPIVDMVLAGRINTYLVRSANVAGFRAVGLGGQDGHLFLAHPMQTANMSDCRTGHPSQVNTELLKLLLKKKYLPVLHSTSMTHEGKGMNINADEVALVIASTLKAKSLLFLSDVDGVQVDGQSVPTLDQKQAHLLIQHQKITGGMVPKIQSSFNAIKNGVGQVVIGQFQLFGDLKKLLLHQKGTTIT
jgi:acetylglutamate kinase